MSYEKLHAETAANNNEAQGRFGIDGMSAKAYPSEASIKI